MIEVFGINIVDLAVIVAYLLGITILGMYMAKGLKRSEIFFSAEESSEKF